MCILIHPDMIEQIEAQIKNQLFRIRLKFMFFIQYQKHRRLVKHFKKKMNKNAVRIIDVKRKGVKFKACNIH